MLYSKNGSIPKPETDGTDGWVEVEDQPEVPEGKELIWWSPPGWVIREPKPADEEGFVWKWSQSSEMWVKYQLPQTVDLAPLRVDEVVTLTSGDITVLTSGDIAPLTTSQISALE